jgi:hypothetical protein
MACSQSWKDERTQSHTQKVHQLQEVGMLTAKIDILMKKLEDLGLDHLKIVDSCMTCEERGETSHMGINCPMTCQDVNFVRKLQWISSKSRLQLRVEQAQLSFQQPPSVW